MPNPKYIKYIFFSAQTTNDKHIPNRKSRALNVDKIKNLDDLGALPCNAIDIIAGAKKYICK